MEVSQGLILIVRHSCAIPSHSGSFGGSEKKKDHSDSHTDVSVIQGIGWHVISKTEFPLEKSVLYLVFVKHLESWRS